MHRFRPAAALAALLLLLLAWPAWAIGRVIPSSDGPVQLDELRVAAAFSSGQTTLWAAFRVSGSASHVAVVLPVAPGSLVDPASDAWFRALERATAPRVIAPDNLAACPGGSSNRVENTAQDAPEPTLHPVQVAVLDTVADLDDFATKNQLALSAADRAALDLPGQRLLALLYALPQGSPAFTQTLRVSEPAELSSLPLGLAWQSGAAPIPCTLWLVAAGRTRIGGTTELAPASVKATWHEFDGNSDYVQKRHDLLALQPGESFVRESSGNERLFGWTVLSNLGGSVPPAADAYFAIAAQTGDTTSDPADCSNSAAKARVAGSIGMAVARACAPGLLARVPLDGGAEPTCTEQVPAGSVDPDSLRCGAADDFAMALSGLRADQAGLTRLRGMLGSHTAPSSPVQQVTADPRTPGVIASKVDSSGCQSSGSGGYGGYSGYSGYGGYGGYGGYSGGSGYSGSGGYSGSYGSSSAGSSGDVYVDTSCSSSNGDSCSGDSSSSSGDSCSGDSSSSSNGSTCGGDSSSSSSGSTCGGDSSSSSSGSTCSGDSSSGDGATCSSGSGDGATCSGDSGSGSGCSLAPGHHAPLSVWSLGLAAVFLPFRRFSRRIGRGRRRRRRGRRVVRAGW